MSLAYSDRYKLYQPTVLTTEFVVPFPIYHLEDLDIQIDGVVEAGYSVTASFVGGVSNNASITLQSAVLNVDVEIYGFRLPRRENNYLANSPNLSANLQRDMDAITGVQQEQYRDFQRSLKSKYGDPLVLDLPAREAGKALVWSETENRFINASVGEGDIAIDVAAVAAARLATADDVIQTGADADQTALDRVQTGEDVAAAQNARDTALAAAATLGATPYATKALMDAVTPGTLPASAYVYADATGANNGLYFYPSGGVAWEKDALDISERLLANEAAVSSLLVDKANAGNIASMAAELGGAYFDISKCQMWQESSLSASTPSKIGDPVGLIKGLDGKYFALAKDDDRRGVLRIDRAGNAYIDGAGTTASGAAFFIRDKDNNVYDPGVDWTLIWTGNGDGRIASVNDSTGWGYPLEMTPDGSLRFTRPDGSPSFGDARSISPKYRTDCCWTARFKKIGTNLQFFAGDELNPRISDFATHDDSAQVRIAVLMTEDARSLPSGGYKTGKMYGVFWVPTDIAETAAANVAKHMATLNDPSKFQSDPRPVILDWINDIVLIRDTLYTFAEAVAAGWLTDNGGGSYTLNYMQWWNVDRTYVYDIEGKFASWSGTEVMQETVGENRVPEQLYGSSVYGILYAGYGSPTTSQGNTASVLNGLPADIPRRREAIRISAGKRVNTVAHDGSVNAYTHTTFPSIPPSGLTFNTETTDFSILRVALYPKYLSGPEVHEAFDRAGTADIHMNGDSFVAQNLDGAFNEFLVGEGYGNLRWTADGAGGLGFHEPLGNGHAQRYQNRQFDHSKVLLISDGGFGEVSGDDILAMSLLDMLRNCYQRVFGFAQEEGAAGGVLEALPLGLDRAKGPARAFFIEPNPMTNAAGTTQRDEFEVKMNNARRLFNSVNNAQLAERYIPTLEALFCAYDDFGASAGDITTGKALAQQARWPSNVSGDGVHLNANGKIVYARAALGYLIDNLILLGTASLPAAPSGLAVNAGVLTWDRVEWADAGRHAIRGYWVYKDGVALPPQPLISYISTSIYANGGQLYGKQYVREFDTTIHGAGDYTVSAITSKGEGPQSAALTVA